MLATPAAVRLAAMLAVRAMWLVITPLVTLAVSAVLAGGRLVFALAALAALTPTMPPPLGGPDTRPDTPSHVAPRHWPCLLLLLVRHSLLV